MLKVKKLTKLTSKQKYQPTHFICIEGNKLIATNAYATAVVEYSGLASPNGVYKREFFEKEFNVTSEQSIMYADETTAILLPEQNQKFPDWQKAVPKDSSALLHVSVEHLKKLLEVFEEQKVNSIDIHVPFEDGLLNDKKAIKIVGHEKPHVYGVIMPVYTH